MIETSEFSTEHLIAALKVYVRDLCDKTSPFPKDEAYLRNLAGWIACAAARLDEEGIHES